MKLRLRPDKSIREEKIRVGRVPVLVLRPAGRPPVPVAVLWIHGGGYITGMKEMVYMSRAADLVKRYGVTVFSPGYRLAWQKPYPAAADDCYRVLEYISGQSETVIVGGESAGGGLAAAVCMMARDRGIKVDWQFPLYPMLSNLDTESSRDNHGRVWNTRRNHLGWKMYLRKDAAKVVSPYASPAHRTDHTGLPPCYTFVGDGEPFYAETLEYVEKLNAAGVEAEADVYHTDMHAFDILRENDLSREARENFCRHFEKTLGQINSNRTLPEGSTTSQGGTHMKIAVRYYTKTGNTKRLAEAIAAEVGVEALPISTPVDEPVDVLFLGNSYYAFSIDPEVRKFVQGLDRDKVGRIVNFGSAAMLNSTYKKVKAEADRAGIPMDEREFHCKGEFKGLHKGRPDEADLKAAAEFARKIVG